jgi:outer membrane protein
MRKIVILAALTLLVLRAPALADEPLSLDAAIAVALQHNVDYGIARAKVDASVAQLRQARAPLAPGLAVEDQYLYVNKIANLSTPLGPIPFSSVNATNVPLVVLQYTLFDGGASAARAGEAAAGLAGSEAAEREARAAVIEATSKAYYDLDEAEVMNAVAQRATDVAQAHVTQAEQLLASGMIPRADLLRAQAESASREVDRIAAENAVKLAALELDNVLNVPLTTVFHPTDALEAPVPPLDQQALLESAHTARGELAAARFAVDAAQAALRAARSSGAPQVKAMVTDGNTQPAVVGGYHNQFSVGLSAVWTLFDNGYTAGGVAQAQAGLHEAQLGLEALQSGIDLQVRRAYLNVSQAQAQSIAARKAAELTDENLRLAQVRYRGGVGTALELQDAALRDRDARVHLTQAQASLRESVVDLRFAAGLL